MRKITLQGANSDMANAYGQKAIAPLKKFVDNPETAAV
jgi:hypothetical protein